jgi:hypothetical protein
MSIKKALEENIESAPVVDKKELLGQFVTGMINKDEDAATGSLKHYLTQKAKEYVRGLAERKGAPEVKDENGETDEGEGEKYLSNRDKKKKPLKKMRKGKDDMKEAALPIRLKGDDVFVNEKHVGSIQNDTSKPDSKIKFKTVNEEKSEEFDSVSDLYSFLVTKFKVNPGVDVETK